MYCCTARVHIAAVFVAFVVFGDGGVRGELADRRGCGYGRRCAQGQQPEDGGGKALRGSAAARLHVLRYGHDPRQVHIYPHRRAGTGADRRGRPGGRSAISIRGRAGHRPRRRRRGPARGGPRGLAPPCPDLARARGQPLRRRPRLRQWDPGQRRAPPAAGQAQARPRRRDRRRLLHAAPGAGRRGDGGARDREHHADASFRPPPPQPWPAPRPRSNAARPQRSAPLLYRGPRGAASGRDHPRGHAAADPARGDLDRARPGQRPGARLADALSRARRHRLGDGRHFVADLGTRNGTALNGERLRGESRWLNSGDSIELGGEPLRYLTGEETRLGAAPQRSRLPEPRSMHLGGANADASAATPRTTSSSTTPTSPASTPRSAARGRRRRAARPRLAQRHAPRPRVRPAAGAGRAGPEIGIGPFRLVFDGSQLRPPRRPRRPAPDAPTTSRMPDQRQGDPQPRLDHHRAGRVRRRHRRERLRQDHPGQGARRRHARPTGGRGHGQRRAGRRPPHRHRLRPAGRDRPPRPDRREALALRGRAAAARGLDAGRHRRGRRPGARRARRSSEHAETRDRLALRRPAQAGRRRHRAAQPAEPALPRRADHRPRSRASRRG